MIGIASVSFHSHSRNTPEFPYTVVDGLGMRHVGSALAYMVWVCLLDAIAFLPSGQVNPAAAARRNVSRTVEGAAPTRYEIALWQSLPQIGIVKSREHTASPISPPASRSFPRTSQKKELLPAGRPAQMPPPMGRHQFGIRGRLFLREAITSYDAESRLRDRSWRALKSIRASPSG